MRPFEFKQTIVIEYDYHDKRIEKKFQNMWKAKAFYVTKFKQNKNPKVKKDIK